MDACRHTPSQYHLTYMHFWTLNIYKVHHQLMLQVSRTAEWVTALPYLRVLGEVLLYLVFCALTLIPASLLLSGSIYVSLDDLYVFP